MSEIDFQNGLVVGLTLAGKNGAVGGVAPPPATGDSEMLLVSGFSYAWDWASKVITGAPFEMTLTQWEVES